MTSTSLIEQDAVVIQLVLVSGSTSTGKSTMAEAIADEIGATVASFDWLYVGAASLPGRVGCR